WTAPPPGNRSSSLPLAPPQLGLNAGLQHLDADPVMAALRQDDVGVALRRLHEFEMHGPHRPEVLLDHHLDRASAVADVAPEPPDEADIIGDVDEDPDVEQLPEPSVGEQQDSLDHHYGARLDDFRSRGTRVAREVVGRLLDALSAPEP